MEGLCGLKPCSADLLGRLAESRAGALNRKRNKRTLLSGSTRLSTGRSAHSWTGMLFCDVFMGNCAFCGRRAILDAQAHPEDTMLLMVDYTRAAHLPNIRPTPKRAMRTSRMKVSVGGAINFSNQQR